MPREIDCFILSIWMRALALRLVVDTLCAANLRLRHGTLGYNLCIHHHHRAHGSIRRRVELCGSRISCWCVAMEVCAIFDRLTRSKCKSGKAGPDARTYCLPKVITNLWRRSCSSSGARGLWSHKQERPQYIEQCSRVRASLHDRKVVFPNVVGSCFTYYMRRHRHCTHEWSEFPSQRCRLHNVPNHSLLS